MGNKRNSSIYNPPSMDEILYKYFMSHVGVSNYILVLLLLDIMSTVYILTIPSGVLKFSLIYSDLRKVIP